MMKKTTLIEIITVLFVILFLYTSISKVMDYSIFKEQLAGSPILRPFSKAIVMGLPALEILIVLMLVIPRLRLKGLIASFILMIIFTVYIIGILIFNKELPCSCGGVLEEMSWPQHIIFNSIFIILALIGISLQKNIINSIRKDRILYNRIDRI